MDDLANISIQPLSVLRPPTRALLASADGSLYCGRHGRIYRSSDGGSRWALRCAIPTEPLKRIAELSRLTCRLLRHEVRAAQALPNGGLVAATRRGLWYAAHDDQRMQPSRVETARGRFFSPPMTLTLGAAGRILWGEYNSSYRHGLPVAIYTSDDGGRTFAIAHVLKPGSTLHVHNLLYDAAADGYWVFSGDYDAEPGIGWLSSDLTRFEWIAKGRQEYRLVEAFDFGDCLVYATDTHLEPNAIIRFHKTTARTERLQELDGSCIYACRLGEWLVVSTTVEPSSVNRSPYASLWISRDGERWRRVYQAKKDVWSGRYFQFGSLVLPRGIGAGGTLLFSGQALEGIDGRSFLAMLPG